MLTNPDHEMDRRKDDEKRPSPPDPVPRPAVPAAEPAPQPAAPRTSESTAASRDSLLTRSRTAGQMGVSQAEKEMLIQGAAQAAAEAAALRKVLDSLLRLQEMSLELSSILDSDRLFERILDFALALTSTEKGLLILDMDGQLEVIQARDNQQNSLDLKAPFSSTLVRECLRKNDAVRLDDVQAGGLLALGKSVERLQIHSAVCVPLQDRGMPTGVLYLVSSQLGLATVEDVLVPLRALASQASVAVGNARRHQSLEQSRKILTRENEGLRAQLRASYGYAKMVGSSLSMSRIYDKIRLLKDTDVSVLIQGESGTGKELVALALHEEGVRRDGRFVAVNCGSIPENLVESTMFGYKKGAFTHAVEDRPGLVEVADGGTLFLDEISDLPMHLQPKLLRFLESGEFRRVGDHQDSSANVRVISATNVDLPALTRQKLFRQDLYYRLGVLRIDLPPLRERREDLPLLIEHFLTGARARTHRSIAGITERARLALLRSDWREGNIRELKNVIEGAAALVPEGGSIDVAELEAVMGGARSGQSVSAPVGPFKEAADQFEKDVLAHALRRAGWNVSKAAAELRISRQHLHNKIRRYGLSRPAR